MMTLKERIESFGSRTSMHGFARIVFSKATPKRLSWLVIFTAAWIFFTVHVSLVFRSYFLYPKQLTTEIVQGGVPFPAITLCNLGSLDFHTISKLNDVANYLRFGNDTTNYTKDPLVQAIEKFYTILNNTSLNDTVIDKFRPKMFSRISLAANIPRQILSANGYQESEFIVKCTIRNQPCKLIKIFDPYFFNCYTVLPPKGTSSEDKEPPALLEGLENGLTVMVLAGTRMLKEELSLDGQGIPGMYDKDSALSGAGGVRVVIHPPGTRPFPLTEGYDVSPFEMASIGLNAKRRKRLQEPYGKCNKHYSFLTTEKSQMAAGPYSRIACQKVCILEHVQNECNCTETSLPTPGDILENAFAFFRQRDTETCQNCSSDKRPGYNYTTETSSQLDKTGYERCRGTNAFRNCILGISNLTTECKDDVVIAQFEKVDCAERVMHRVMTSAEVLSECDCHPGCDDVLYDASYSLSQWPSQGLDGDSVYYEIFYDLKFITRFSSADKRAKYDAYVEHDVKRAMKDFAKINVFISDNDVTVTTENPAMTFTQLMSDIGGQLGVWIGVSVITLAEVLELLLSILLDHCWGRSKPERDIKLNDAENGVTGSEGAVNPAVAADEQV